MPNPAPRYQVNGMPMYMFGGWDFTSVDMATQWIVNTNSWANMGDNMQSYLPGIDGDSLLEHLKHFLGEHGSNTFNIQRVSAVMPTVEVFDFDDRPAVLCILMSLMGQTVDYDRSYLTAWYGKYQHALSLLVNGVSPENVAHAIENDVDLVLISSL